MRLTRCCGHATWGGILIFIQCSCACAVLMLEVPRLLCIGDVLGISTTFAFCERCTTAVFHLAFSQYSSVLRNNSWKSELSPLSMVLVQLLDVNVILCCVLKCTENGTAFTALRQRSGPRNKERRKLKIKIEKTFFYLINRETRKEKRAQRRIYEGVRKERKRRPWRQNQRN